MGFNSNFYGLEGLGKMINFSNYTPQSVSDKGKTHEVAVAPLVPTSSVAEHTFTGKSIRFAQSLSAINDFPKFSLRENFCKLHIQLNSELANLLKKRKPPSPTDR